MGTLRLASLAPLVLYLAACVSAPTPKPPPPGGYETLRFRTMVSVRDHATNLYTFAAGTTLVSDRVSDAGTVYCGTVALNEQATPVCVGYEDGALVIGPDSVLKRVVRPVPAGSVVVGRAAV